MPCLFSDEKFDTTYEAAFFVYDAPLCDIRLITDSTLDASKGCVCNHTGDLWSACFLKHISRRELRNGGRV